MGVGVGSEWIWVTGGYGVWRGSGVCGWKARAVVAAGGSLNGSASAGGTAGVQRVVAVQHSNARITKFNRKSRFGERLATTDAESDEILFDVLSADLQNVEIEDLEAEVVLRKAHRKLKKLGRTASKRIDAMASSKLVQSEEPSPSMELDSFLRSDSPPPARVNGRRGMKVQPPVALKLRVNPTPGEEFTARKNWEEQAYQIIRRQKLRDAAVADANARLVRQAQKGMAEAPTIEPSEARADGTGPQHPTSLTRSGGGMEDVDFRRMSRRLSLEAKWRPLVDYLHGLGVQEGDFNKIVDRHKACLQTNVNVVTERVEFLLGLGVKFQDLPKLIVRHPQILEYRVEQAMKPRVLYLKSLGLDDAKLGRIITLAPTLLECSLERSIKPRVNYLLKTVGIKNQDISTIVTRSPQILTQSIEDSLKPRVDYFLNEVKLSKEALAKMITKHPQLLHYSVEDGIRPRVEYLRSIGMSDEDVLKVLTRLTQILSLSIDSCLRPKFEYLVKDLKGGVQTVTSFPAYFSLSLEQRIIPRHKYLEMLDKTPRGPFPMRLLTVSDSSFCEWAKSSLQDYQKFRQDLLLTTFARKFEWKNNVQI